jgi:transposase
MKVKQEKLEWLADNPFYSKRFAFFVGRRCRVMTIKDVAQETHLDWKTVKELDKQYMREQVRRTGTPAPKVIGVDEIAIRKGHTYRIVVSDLCAAARSGLVARTAANRAWTSFFSGLGQRKVSR